ncbi:hypothetical protein [Nannocystis punicea]|uniref:Uncharacterized protein n=1 Tax=Nannocystis punicea TaxID=2995304 RepID=A0ABY7GSA7_9BACT|nr:hypothetical protein [Nannocystis poenicansa]WAS89830.1 hypothetical protein O0S08_26865 [Nannocystis poenicansa]
MRRGPHAIALVLLLAGCGLHHERVWAGALLHAPFIYLVGLAVVYALYRPWARADPALRFGREHHWVTFAGLFVLAVWAAPKTKLDGLALFWGLFGGTTLTLWLLVLRIGLAWPKSQPFLWSGAAAFGLTLQFALAGLLDKDLKDYGEFGIVVWVFGGGFGATLAVVLAVLGFEARRIGRRADAAVAAVAAGTDEPPRA